VVEIDKVEELHHLRSAKMHVIDAK